MGRDESQSEPTEAGVSPELMALLACPSCRQPLDQRGALLVCRGCGLGYPVRDGIPVLLVAEAVPQDACQ